MRTGAGKAPRVSPPRARPTAGVARASAAAVVTRTAPFLLAFLVYFTAYLIMDPGLSGDEPHYLVASQSIAYDGDLDLANDMASTERTRRLVGFFPLAATGHAADYTGSGQLRPVHQIGLSALLAGPVAVGGVDAAQLVMVLLAALLAHQLLRLLADLGLRRRYRLAAWVAAVFCLPLLAFSSQVYPELPASLLVVVALRVLVRGAATPGALALGSSAGAALVWLHTRYLPFSLALFLGLAYAALAGEPARRGGARRRPAALVAPLVDRWRSVTLPLVVPYLLGLGALAAVFQHLYGSPSPAAQYAPLYQARIGSAGWTFWYEHALADLLDPVFGWIPYAPVHWLALAALGCLVLRYGWPAAIAVGVALTYELAIASIGLGGSAGWGFPARLLVVLIPLVAVPIAVGLEHVRAARLVFVPLVVVSLVFAAAGVRHHELLYPSGETPRLFGVRSIGPAFPVVTSRPHLPRSYVLEPGTPPPTTGEVRAGTVVAGAGRHRPGFLLWGPYTVLKSGAYRARFRLAGTRAGAAGRVATLDVYGQPPGTALARRVVSAGELRGRGFTELTLDFVTPGDLAIQTRVFFHGRGTLRAGAAEVAPAPYAPETPRFPDWPLAFLWVGGTAFVGALFVEAMSRPRRSPRPAG